MPSKSIKRLLMFQVMSIISMICTIPPLMAMLKLKGEERIEQIIY
ncbi:hypothetical protein [Cytobacillus sp.]|nr:hypothetical protein [Cytobacillus sp.]